MNSNRLKWAAVVLGAVLAAALVLGAVGLTTAAAQEPDGAVAEIVARRPQPGDTMTTVLQPGDNLVGWIEGATPVTDLFDDIAEIEAVWAWDALRRQWSAASRRVPSELHTLRTLKPGMGLLVQVGGDEAVEWQRSAYPARGLVELRPGYNLVAWSGRDGSTIGDVVKGVGWSLRSVRRQDAVSRQWAVWTSPERSDELIVDDGSAPGASSGESDTPTIRRGEALWIEVGRTVHWLQPTGVLPPVDFPPESTQQQRDSFSLLFGGVLELFAERYGIEADHSAFVVYPMDISGGGANFSRLHVPQDECLDVSDGGRISDRSASRCLKVLAHEYFHVLQHHLSYRIGIPWGRVDGEPTWMSEGAAERVGWTLASALLEEEGRSEASRMLNQSFDRRWDCAFAGDPFEVQGFLWDRPYRHGELAAAALTARAGDASIVEFWQRLAPSLVGPQFRWESKPSWHDAFSHTFGISVRDFYVELHQQWQAWAQSAPCLYGDSDWRAIQGTLTYDNGSPAPGVLVRLAHIPSRSNFPFTAVSTNASGQFRLRLPSDWDGEGVVLEIRQDDTCLLFYGSDGFAASRLEASPIALEGQGTDVSIRMSRELCPRISGRVVDQNGNGVSGIRVAPGNPRVVGSMGGHTFEDGFFSFQLSGLLWKTTELSVALDYFCSYNSYSEASQRFDLTKGDVDGVRIEVPADFCTRQIRGRLIDADGTAIPHILVEAAGESPGTDSASASASDGSFAITIPESGQYRLFMRDHTGACRVFYVEDDSDRSDASRIRVTDGRDVSGIVFQVPDNPCG